MSVESHLTPNGELISYSKLYKLVTHQVNLLTEELKKVDEDPLYYVLHDEEAVKNYRFIETARDEWLWLQENSTKRYAFNRRLEIY